MGLPTDNDLYGMSKNMKPNTIELINRIDDIPKKDFCKILPKDYSVSAPYFSYLLPVEERHRVSFPIVGVDAQVEPSV